jgi:hypothetical protein
MKIGMEPVKSTFSWFLWDLRMQKRAEDFVN